MGSSSLINAVMAWARPLATKHRAQPDAWQAVRVSGGRADQDRRGAPRAGCAADAAAAAAIDGGNNARRIESRSGNALARKRTKRNPAAAQRSSFDVSS